jgi:hypothetical protein
MAIDRIPGVGPANSDIAAAVAAPSAATIAAAVAAPSAATIAAAVAAPSAATIAAAVAAPSSATIATAVAAAVPTIGAINTSVANNAPSANLITYITVASPSSATSFTISGLTGYRTLYVYAYFTTGTDGSTMGMRLNAATDNCTVAGVETRTGSTSALSPRASITNTNNYRFATGNAINSGVNALWMKIDACTNTTTIKPISSRALFNGGGQNTPWGFDAYGFSRTTAAVSSIEFTNLASGQNFSGDFYVFGAN